MEDSGPKAETLPLGHRGLLSHFKSAVDGYVMWKSYAGKSALILNNPKPFPTALFTCSLPAIEYFPGKQLPEEHFGAAVLSKLPQDMGSNQSQFPSRSKAPADH
ncbi:hypothetical protein AVEN_12746-1 [Araneus ventricosus]|uniref:Uncharacterized protein n=1 Tax=Araneus ventricosus TaxID=182803 RepID=A0A4Y2ADQ3_ARAVE|nr:hypothetical protein AVEN_12746-1 [Araneus ventricosus]